MTAFSRCGFCGCAEAETDVFRCQVCALVFCARCGLALSVEHFTYCPRCGSMKHRDEVLAGRIGPRG
jgi:hypothetical protein